MKLVVFHDPTDLSIHAVRMGAMLATSLERPLTVMVARPGTVPIEQQPKYGEELEREFWEGLPPGLKLLTKALMDLEEQGVFDHQEKLLLLEEPHGERAFYVKTKADTTVRFLVRFGDPFDTIKEEVYADEAGLQTLLVIADPGPQGLHRMFTTNLAHRASLDLMVSVLAVKGDHREAPVFLCADGSHSAKRAYPVLNWMLPALTAPFKVIGVTEIRANEVLRVTCETCAKRARAWLAAEDKDVDVVIRNGEKAHEIILEEAGENALIVVGASMKGEFAKRLRGSVPLRLMEEGKATILLAKALPGEEVDWGD